MSISTFKQRMGKSVLAVSLAAAVVSFSPKPDGLIVGKAYAQPASQKTEDKEVAQKLKALRNRNKDIRYQAYKELVNVVEFCTCPMATPDKESIASPIRDWCPENPTSGLIKATGDKRARGYAYGLLSRIGDSRLIPLFVRALRSPDSDARAYAVRGLDKIVNCNKGASSEVLKAVPLIRIIEQRDPDYHNRCEAKELRVFIAPTKDEVRKFERSGEIRALLDRFKVERRVGGGDYYKEVRVIEDARAIPLLVEMFNMTRALEPGQLHHVVEEMRGVVEANPGNPELRKFIPLLKSLQRDDFTYDVMNFLERIRQLTKP